MTENIEKQLEGEISKYEQILASDPDSKAFAQLAETLRKLGKLDEALSVCADGLKKHPDFSGAAILLGRIYMEMGKFGEAERELVKVLQRVPNHLLAHQLLVRVYLKLGKNEHAIAIAKRIVKMSPDDATALAVLNNASKPAAKPAEPEEPMPTVTMAKLYEDQGHFDKALEIYKTLLSKQPELQGDIDRVENLVANQAKISRLSSFLDNVKQRGSST